MKYHKNHPYSISIGRDLYGITEQDNNFEILKKYLL
jgi:hypothetical protein